MSERTFEEFLPRSTAILKSQNAFCAKEQRLLRISQKSALYLVCIVNRIASWLLRMFAMQVNEGGGLVGRHRFQNEFRPLHWAAFMGHESIVRLLLSHGIRVYIHTCMIVYIRAYMYMFIHFCALHCSAFMGHESIVCHLTWYCNAYTYAYASVYSCVYVYVYICVCIYMFIHFRALRLAAVMGHDFIV